MLLLLLLPPLEVMRVADPYCLGHPTPTALDVRPLIALGVRALLPWASDPYCLGRPTSISLGVRPLLLRASDPYCLGRPTSIALGVRPLLPWASDLYFLGRPTPIALGVRALLPWASDHYCLGRPTSIASGEQNYKQQNTKFRMEHRKNHESQNTGHPQLIPMFTRKFTPIFSKVWGKL